MRLFVVFGALFLGLSSGLQAACSPAEGDQLLQVLRQSRNLSASVDKTSDGYTALKLQIREAQTLDSIARSADCIADETYTRRFELLAELQIIMEQAGTEDDRLLLYQDLGIDLLITSLGFTQLSTEARQKLRAQLQANNDAWDDVSTRLDNVTLQRRKLQSKLKWLAARLFAYQALVTSGILANLFYYAGDFLPSQVTSPTGLAAAGVLVVAQSVGLAKLAWPRFRRYAREHYVKKQYEKVLDALADVIRAHPEKGIPFVLEMARHRSEKTGELERAALSALMRVRIPQTSEALVTLAVQALEVGQIELGVSILHEITSRSEDSVMGQIATAVTKAIEEKQEFERHLNQLKRRFLFRRTSQAFAVTAGALAIAHWIDPVQISILKTIGLQVAGTVGARQLFLRIWFTYPETALRKDLTVDRERLKESFDTLLELAPEHTIQFVVGVASLGNQTHPFIREAALDAIKESNHPLTAKAFADLGLQAMVSRSDQEIVRGYLDESIKRRQGCNHEITKYVWPQREVTPPEAK